GRERQFDETAYRKANTAAANTLKNLGGIDAVNYLSELRVKGRDTAWLVKQGVMSALDSFYRFEQCRSQSEDNKRSLQRMTFAVASRTELADAENGLREGIAIGHGKDLAKDLGNLPGNLCTPTYLADQAKKLAADNAKLSTTILEEDEMEKLGMGSLLSVSRGSREPAKLIIMEYNGGAKDDKPLVLVGKGLTFDAGGISLKPAAGMDEMKYDMCGAASVFGAVQAAVELDLPLNIIGVVPSSENLPDGAANKPGDIVTSMSGTTIEILNTDAEGRLILCDALTYVERNYQPAAVVDMATLTGACVIALGSHASALFTNNEKLGKALRAAGELSGDRAWPMPLWPEYDAQLKSPFADVAIVGGREAGAITAAAFLGRFTKKLRWAHLDIAGTAWNSGKNKGATGRPVALLTEWLLSHVEN
ncbi:MAG: leucyl aminopeptidase, partial [Salinisphaeraceae bacterium]|nr:leucyl aminopeptidase [Salinisphaeraceae bacterium]